MPPNEGQIDEFLKLEYEKSIDLIKYYDERLQSLVKFAAGLSAALPAFLISVYRFGPREVTDDIHFYIGLLCLMTTVGLLTIFVTMVQNRLYFVQPARQANSIRRVMVESIDVDGFSNRMYTNPDFPAWKVTSSQTVLMLFTALQAGVYFAIFLAFALIPIESDRATTLCASAIGGFALTACTMIFAARYLKSKGKASADEAVHEKR